MPGTRIDNDGSGVDPARTVIRDGVGTNVNYERGAMARQFLFPCNGNE